MTLETAKVIVLDTETTGLDFGQDQVIEISIRQGTSDDSPQRTWRIKPSVPMSAGAQQRHGISMEDLANCPPFPDVASEVRPLLDDAEVVIGYRVSFDLEMLQAEFRRLGQPLDLSTKLIVDPYQLWFQCEGRTLQDAHKRFAGGGFENAHSAAADTAATAHVLLGMIKAFGLEGMNWDELAEVCEQDRAYYIGPTRHIQWQDGVPVIGFGKHTGKPVAELAMEGHGGYLKWVIAQDFPPHVKRICNQAMNTDADTLMSWVSTTFGGPPSMEA